MSGKLRPSDVASLGDGMHGDGEMLFLRVRGSARSWIVRRSINGKKLDAGLGSVDRVSLAVARKERDKLVEQWRDGKDPVAERRAEREARANRKTFGEVARLKIKLLQPGWRTSFDGKTGTLDIWTRNMEADCAAIAHKAVDELTVDDIKRVVAPYWQRGTHKAGRDFLKRIEMVFNLAIASGWRTSANPAAWPVFKELWPATQKRKEHHVALPWQDVPAFFKRVRESAAAAARILELAILTASRCGETRGARWSEIDFAAKTWKVPAERMKMKDGHVVPLSDQAIALLQRVKAEGLKGEWVFPAYVNDGRRCDRDIDVPFPHANIWRLVKRLGGDDALTVHGFRSTFRDWCGEHGHDRELAERSLAHKFGSEVEEAYARSRLIARRAPLMQQWADYCCGDASAVVVPFKRSA